MSSEDKHLVVWFMPEAIRQHFDNPAEAGLVEGITDKDLREAATAWMTGNDYLWHLFNDGCHDIVDLAKGIRDKREDQ